MTKILDFTKPQPAEYINPAYSARILKAKEASRRFGEPWGIAIAQKRNACKTLTQKINKAKSDHGKSKGMEQRLVKMRCELMRLESI